MKAKNNVCKRVKLDFSEPGTELLKESYELAARVWAMSPWEKIRENQILGVLRADGRCRFFSVMGREGTHRAIAQFMSVAAYHRINAIDPHDNYDCMDAFFSTLQFQLAFGPADDLMKGEKERIKSAGMKFKNGAKPSFFSYMPGFEPWRLGADELKEYVEFAKIFIDFLETHDANEVAAVEADYPGVSIWKEGKDGKWSLILDEDENRTAVTAEIPPELIAEVQALPANKKEYLEVGVFPIPMGKTPQGRGKMSRIILFVDGPSQFVRKFEMIESPDDTEFDWSPVCVKILEAMQEFGNRPGHLAVFGKCAQAVMRTICDEIFDDTEFMPNNPCDSAHEVFKLMSQQLGL